MISQYNFSSGKYTNKYFENVAKLKYCNKKSKAF